MYQATARQAWPITHRHMRWKAVPSIGALVLLAGCATTKLDHLTMAAPQENAVAPANLQVAVTLAPDLAANPTAERAAHLLQVALVDRYRKIGVPAAAASDVPASGSATIRVRVSGANAGSESKRLLIGFGVGRASIKTDTTLEIDGQAAPAMGFSSTSKGGRRPGLILSGSIAAATGEVTSVAIGAGVGVLADTREGLKNEARRSAHAIVKQTEQFYRSAGWHLSSGKAEAA